MRIPGVLNKYEILQQYYLENGEQITYDEAIELYYELEGDEKDDFLNYYNDYCKEYYGNDSVDYEPVDENGYNWRDFSENGYESSRKNNIKVKYTLEAYAKEQGLTIDSKWALYSAEEIIQMENSGVNIPKDVLEIAHSIYESTTTNYVSTTTDAEDNATAEKEPFLELVPKAAKKIEKCEENNEKISDAIDELLPEKNRRERALKDKMNDQRKSLEEYEAFVKEWNKIQTKINNGEALSDKEAQRYAELTGMFEEKKSGSDDSTFSIDKQEIAKSLNEINIYVTLGEDLADETIDIGETLSDYTSKTNYKTTAKSVSKEVGFIRSIIAMAKGKTLAKEAVKTGNDTKEYTTETKTSVNDIATVLDIKDQLISPEELNAPESENGTGAVQENDPESINAQQETKAQGVTEEEDFQITDDSIKQLTGEAADINGELLSQTVKAIKSIKVAKNDEKFAVLANIKVTRLVKEFKEEEEKRRQQTETLEDQNTQLKKEITDITGESEDEIDKDINSGKNNSKKYNGMEESDKKTVEQNKQTIAENNQAIATLQDEGVQATETFKSRTAKEKSTLDKAIPEENKNIADHTEQKEEVIPQAKEDLDFTENSGITLTKIGKYRVQVGLMQVASFQFAKGLRNIAKGTISMGIGIMARVTANTPIPELADKMTSSALDNGTKALKSLNSVNENIVAITGEDTPQGVSKSDEEQKQEGENEEKADSKPVTNEANSSESQAEGAAETGEQTNIAVKEATAAISMQEPSNTAPVPVSPSNQAAGVKELAASRDELNSGRNTAVSTNTGSVSGSDDDEVPEVNKGNAQSEAKKANDSLGDIKSDTEKGQKETEQITKDEEKSEKQLAKEAKKLQKQINKEAKEMQKLQKETEKIQEEQTKILEEFQTLTIENEQLAADAQSAAANQSAQPANNQNNQQSGGVLGSNSFNVGQTQNSVVNEKISSLETNNQKITELGIKFTSNDQIVQRNQKKITASQKFIKTSSKKFTKVTKTKEKKANERLKAEEAKQKALQKKLGLVGIFEKVFQVVGAIGSVLSLIPYTAALGALLVKIGVAGTLFCGIVKAGIMAANGMIDQAFITLGMSIATAALSMVGTGQAASGALQAVSAALNVVSSAASLGASIQEFQGKDAGILGSIATIAGAASAVTNAVGSFGSLGKSVNGVAKSGLSKVSTVLMQSGSLVSSSSQVISQVREWQGKEGSNSLTNIMGMIGMGLTLAGTAGNIASNLSDSKSKNNNKSNSKNDDKKVDSTEKSDSKNKTEKNEASTKRQQIATQNTNTTEIQTNTNNTTTENTTNTDIDTTQTDVQQQQASELKQAATQDSQDSTDEVIEDINETLNNDKEIPETESDVDEEIAEDIQTVSQTTNSSDITSPETTTNTDIAPSETQTGVQQTDVQQQQAEALKQAAVEGPEGSTNEVLEKIDNSVNNNSNSDTSRDEQLQKEMSTIFTKDPKTALDESIKNADIELKPVEAPAASKQSKFEKFMEKAEPYMQLIGTAGELAGSIMANNDETDDNTKRKVIPAWEFDRRTQEIMKKRRKRLDYLKKRYYA